MARRVRRSRRSTRGTRGGTSGGGKTWFPSEAIAINGKGTQRLALALPGKTRTIGKGGNVHQVKIPALPGYLVTYGSTITVRVVGTAVRVMWGTQLKSTLVMRGLPNDWNGVDDVQVTAPEDCDWVAYVLCETQIGK
jgi:hypothetical protein